MNHALTTTLLASLCLTLAACAEDGDDEKGQSGTDVLETGCGEMASERAIAPDELINGVSPAQLAMTAAGTYAFRTGFYGAAPGSSPALPGSREVAGTFTVTADATGARERRWRTPKQPQESCPITVDIPAVITLATDDGTLSGAFVGSLTGQQQGGVWVYGASRRNALAGSYDASWYADNPNLFVQLLLEREGTRTSTLAQGNMWMDDVNAPRGTKGTALIISAD